jgi:hypothetical protein
MEDRLTPVDQRRFGRRAGDAMLRTRFHAAAFVAQVAGLSMPREAVRGGYEIAEPQAPRGLVRDEKA